MRLCWIAQRTVRPRLMFERLTVALAATILPRSAASAACWGNIPTE
jgi:hypothetical protein